MSPGWLPIGQLNSMLSDNFNKIFFNAAQTRLWLAGDREPCGADRVHFFVIVARVVDVLPTFSAKGSTTKAG
jgi:hypothetical protein